MQRREFLKATLTTGGALLAASKGLLTPREVIAAWPKTAFASTSLQDAITLLLGASDIETSELIEIELPEISENSASVPVVVRADRIKDVETISLFSEKNPLPLLASFEMSGMVANRLTTRVKLSETTHVIAVVKTKGRLLSARRKTKVTVGGCGG